MRDVGKARASETSESRCFAYVVLQLTNHPKTWLKTTQCYFLSQSMGCLGSAGCFSFGVSHGCHLIALGLESTECLSGLALR